MRVAKEAQKRALEMQPIAEDGDSDKVIVAMEQGSELEDKLPLVENDRV